MLISFIVDKLLGIKSKSYCTLLFQISSDIRYRKVKTAGPQTEKRIDSTYINSNWCLSRIIDSTYINLKLVPISQDWSIRHFTLLGETLGCSHILVGDLDWSFLFGRWPSGTHYPEWFVDWPGSDRRRTTPQNRRHQQLQKTQWRDMNVFSATRWLFGELTNRTQSDVVKVFTLARTGFTMMQLRTWNYDYSSHWETRAIDASPTSIHILSLMCALSKTSMIHSCEAIFKTARDYTVEWIKLYNTIFVLETDTFSSFFASFCSSGLMQLASGPRAWHHQRFVHRTNSRCWCSLLNKQGW